MSDDANDTLAAAPAPTETLGRNANDTMRVTRLNGVPLLIESEEIREEMRALRQAGPMDSLLARASQSEDALRYQGPATSVSRLSRRLDRARADGEVLAPGEALREIEHLARKMHGPSAPSAPRRPGRGARSERNEN